MAAAPPDVVAAAPARGRLQERRLVLLVVAAVAVIASVAYGVWRAHRPLEWSGTIEARTISIGSRTGGRVKDVLVREGDLAKANQPLVVLEVGDLDAQRLMAEAQLEQARSTLDKLRNGARPEEIEEANARAHEAAAAFAETRQGARPEQVEAARARLVVAQVAVDKAELDADRAHKLFNSASISQADLDNADASLRGAVAQRDAARQSLDELVNGSRREDVQQAAARAREAHASAKLVQIGTRAEDLHAAEAQVDAAKGKLDQVQVMIDELTIRAPRAARVETLDLRPGDILAPNATAGVLLEDDQLYVRIYVPETQIGHVHVGDEVPIYVDSFPGRAFRATVEHIEMQGEYSPRNLQTADERANQVFATRVGLREGHGELRAGMAAFLRVARR